MLQGRGGIPAQRRRNSSGLGGYDYADYMIDNQIDHVFGEDKIISVPRSYKNANIDYNVGSGLQTHH